MSAALPGGVLEEQARAKSIAADGSSASEVGRRSLYSFISQETEVFEESVSMSMSEALKLLSLALCLSPGIVPWRSQWKETVACRAPSLYRPPDLPGLAYQHHIILQD